VVAAQEFRHESKEPCTEFEISMYWLEGATISVAQSLRKMVFDVEVKVELFTSGQPAVSTMTVEVDGPAEVVAVDSDWSLLFISVS
jgi:hypothetical protein